MKRLTLLLAGLSLAATAQAASDVLAHVPANARQFVYYPSPAASARKFTAMASRFEAKGSFVGKAHLNRWGLDLDAQEGPLMLAEVDGEGNEAAHLLALRPIRPETLLTSLKAQKGKEGWTYRLPGKGGKPGAMRHAVLRDGVLLLATEKEALAPGKVEDLSTLRPWMAQTDMVAGMPRLTLAQGLNKAALGIGVLKAMPDEPTPKAAEGEETPKADPMAAGLKAIKPLVAQVEPLVIKLQESADLAAFALAMGPEGMRVKAQVFFKPGSPMASPSFTPAAGTTLQGIPGTDFIAAMGMSGAWMAPMTGFGTAVVEAMVADKVAPELLQRWKTASHATAAALQNMAFTLALPTRAGAPLLSGSLGVLKVKDARTYLKDMAESQALNAQIMKGMGEAGSLGFTPELQPDLLPGVPSLGMTFDLSKLGGGQALPPQAAMALGLVLGGPQVKVAYGALDDHTIACVLGEGPALQDALARVKAGTPLEGAPIVQAALGSLPRGGFFEGCFSAKGLGEAVKTVVTQFGGPKMPELPEMSGAVMAASFYWNPTGLGMEAVAPEGSLKDAAALVKVFNAMDAKKAAPAQGARKKSAKA